MATRQKRRKQKEQELKEAENYLDQRRVQDGQERFWSAESGVRLRTFEIEERIKNTPTIEGKDSNPRFVLEAKAELERRKAELERRKAVLAEEERREEAEVEEQRRVAEEKMRKREESRQRIKHSISVSIISVRSEVEADERRMQLEAELEHVDKEEEVELEEEERKRKASEEKRRLRGEEREMLEAMLEKVIKWLKKIGCPALAAEIPKAADIEKELQSVFGYPVGSG